LPLNHHITDYLVFVLVSTERVICPATYNPSSCEIWAVIPFMVKKMSAAEIFRELDAVYSQNVISEGTLRQWHRMYKDGQTDVHDEE
jgi:hypothetical protein